LNGLKKEHQILKVVSDDKSFIVIDEDEWNNIYETIYLLEILQENPFKTPPPL
jgi:PHD/YefM family antitoxin component YafN of YafNO toxin-antitoxin module